MNRPSPLAEAIERSIRKIARRDGISLRRAAEVWMADVHRYAAELRKRRKHEAN